MDGAGAATVRFNFRFVIRPTYACDVFSNLAAAAAATNQEGMAAPSLLDIGFEGQVYLSNLDAVASTDWLAQVAPTMVVTCAAGPAHYDGLDQFGLVQAAIAELPMGSRPAHLRVVPSHQLLA